ncbi:MAG: response regulator transcription factor [Clostridiales Family XIII bacterium]|jgi:DNA-binding response OmpR family regulator|nr:response regulator transcription factor [Clostridiales Family XIII bacterium]
MGTILIVEDDKSLNRGISLVFGQDGMNILQAYELKTARELFAASRVDLIILDVGLPDGSGLDFCKAVRASSSVPIIFLTANDMEADIVMGFELGGDDYITKPFSLMVLRARVMAALRRAKAGGDSRVAVGDMIFDFDRMEFSKNGKAMQLTKTEQKLLRKLVANRGSILTREQLMEDLYPNESKFVDENALTVAIGRLRGKLEDDPANPLFIKTVYGLGYICAGTAE